MSASVTYKPEWVREDFIDFIAEKINPLWAWKRVKAAVIQTEYLSADFVKITLRPNANFKQQGLQAGQSVLCSMLIAGVRQQRSYSIVERLANNDLVIALRIQGLVSTQLAKLCVGDVLEISQPQGDFLLDQSNNSIALIASGSGITAIYALLKAALEQNFNPIELLYFTRDDVFHVELEQLAKQYQQFNYHAIHTQKDRQHLDLALLNKMIPDFKSRMIYACGSHAMMQSINEICDQLNIRTQLKQEYFQLKVDQSLAHQPITFLRAQQQFVASTNLLESAESAGLRPTHGCRMGICNSCSCTKVTGSTKNLLTGEIDHQSNTQIKLCISQAVSPVVINL